MKAQLYLALLAFLSLTSAKAQLPDSAQAIAHYKFSHLRDTTAKDKPYTENMMLIIGRVASSYRSYDRKLREEQMRKSVADQVAAGGAGSIRINSGPGGLGTSTIYYQFPNENKLVTQERLINSYLIYEAMPALQWTIASDTASFSGLPCQKATTHFKGRDYTAWFCPDLPYRTGPWKLNGLPGLILEAYDTKKEVVFKFDGFEKVVQVTDATGASDPVLNSTNRTTIMVGSTDDLKQNPNLITLPANGIRITAKELEGLKEVMRKDPQAFIQAQMAGMQSQMGGNVRAMLSPGASITVNKSSVMPTVINNPVELPEKK